MTIYCIPKKNLKTQNYLFKQKAKEANVYLKVIDLHQIHNFLINQKPNTYIISLVPGQIDQYYLSYVREEDRAIIHVQFQRDLFGLYEYRNVALKKDVSISGIVRKIIHYHNGQYLPRHFL